MPRDKTGADKEAGSYVLSSLSRQRAVQDRDILEVLPKRAASRYYRDTRARGIIVMTWLRPDSGLRRREAMAAHAGITMKYAY